MMPIERSRYLAQANAELAQLNCRWYKGEMTRQEYRRDRAEIIMFLLAHAKSLQAYEHAQAQKKEDVKSNRQYTQTSRLLKIIKAWFAI